jgi:hypothetical protein
MQFSELLGFRSGINNLTFLLLYEATWLGKWLQTFRQTVRVSFSKGQTSKTILPVDDITTIFHRKVRETNSKWRGGLNTQLVVSRA